MEGQWRVEHPGERTERVLRRQDLRAAVLTDTWSAFGLRLGMLDLVPTAREGDLVGHLGPDVLGPDWDAAVAAARVTASARFVGDTLLDQRVLAGVGTFWASEILFLERVLPWTPAADLDPERVTRHARPAAPADGHRAPHRLAGAAPASSARARRPTCTRGRAGRAGAAATRCGWR